MARSMLCALLVLALTCLRTSDALYTKNSPVLQVTAKTYDSLIAQSNHISIVEFYAPWCGHCQNLKPAYEKAAKNLAGLAKVAAINCDDDANKPFCGQMGIQGFPTLKIVKPGPKPGRPVVEDYNGARSTKAIVDAVKDKIPNHVKRLQGDAFDTWLSDQAAPAKAIVFTDKGTTSPLIKSLAIDFLGSIAFAQVRDRATAEKYQVTEFPLIQLIPAFGESPISYVGEINRDSLVSFFSQVAPPNPDPAPKSARPSKSSSKTAQPAPASSASAAFSSASDAHQSSDFDDDIAGSGTIVLDEDAPSESPLPIVEQEEKPMVVPEAIPPIPTLATPAEVEDACLTPTSGNCILVLLPSLSDSDAMLPETALSALAGLAEIANRYGRRHARMIPTYAVPRENQAASRISQDLSLNSEGNMEIIALNMKRGWWRRYASESYDVVALESFIDAIKLGEGTKSKLPADFGATTASESSESDTTETVANDDEPDSETTVAVPEHDEL
ncbi:protein disulfide-isomerase domain [Rhinocladiella mackenziei CBS 650.93]|uniref:protein disulfide-isomerase n=1 Tax=Rhinocladiella mackenziei CBS 650.93 TaxID=1442369 RepID=A0A0D2IDU1_9EURO|nr:protein disulfide-isomerase domain [Rhinocladiella mackenziei CBS 650.93]KIX01421.1 protein disulfide-isomerase domain [Rhinocladiella mackenziei CBS 650.93]